MKVVAFNCSPRPDGNTFLLLDRALEPLRQAGAETEIVQVGGKPLRGCTACYWCMEHKVGRCVMDDDILNDCYARMVAADAILIGSPTYFADVTAEAKALIDRTGLVSIANGRSLRRKLGAAVIAVRRAGAVHAFDTINHWLLINEMIVPGSVYWNLGIGRGKGEVTEDEEGLTTMRMLGENMAWLLERTTR